MLTALLINLLHMNKNLLKIIVVIVLVVGCVLLFKNGGTAQNKNETGPIKIGVIEPLTGGAASYGEATRNGFLLAVEEINAAGGINGRKIEAVYEDSKCSGKDALSAASKLINVDKVQYLAGAMCSSEVLAALPLTEPKTILFFGQGSSPDITGKGKYFFRTFPSDALSGKALAEKFVPQYKKIAIISEKTDYAIALSKTFSANAKQLGASILADETFTSGETDFKAYLLRIKTQNPDFIFVNPQTGQSAAIIIKQAKSLGIKAQFATFFMTGDEFVKANDSVNGTIILDLPSLNVENAAAKKFLDAYEARFKLKDYPFMAAQMYDYAYLLKQTIEKSGDSANANRDYLKSMQKYSGVIGDFSFDQNGDVNGIGYTFRKVENNTLVNLK
jgi:branched-chain amino acid transport system substrate-binding protein